jgi:hypothetical protein
MSSGATPRGSEIKMEDLRPLVLASLEAARVEVVERMKAKGFPTSVAQPQLIAKYKEDGTGSGSEWVTVNVSGLRDDQALIAIRDESVPHIPLGLRSQLGELAQYLDDHTDLGAKWPMGFLPGMEGVDGVLARCLSPLAMHYLGELQDVALPEEALAEQLADELICLRRE